VIRIRASVGGCRANCCEMFPSAAGHTSHRQDLRRLISRGGSGFDVAGHDDVDTVANPLTRKSAIACRLRLADDERSSSVPTPPSEPHALLSPAAALARKVVTPAAFFSATIVFHAAAFRSDMSRRFPPLLRNSDVVNRDMLAVALLGH